MMKKKKNKGINQEELLFSIMNLSYDFMQQYHNGGGGSGSDDTWRNNIDYKLYKVT